MRALFIASEDEENLSVRYPAASLVQAGHAIAIAPFSAPEDTGRVLAQAREFGTKLIAILVAFQSRAAASREQ